MVVEQSFKEGVSRWGFSTRAKLANKVSELASGESRSTPSLRKSLTTSVKTSRDLPKSVQFKFVRHGVFFQKGVGRGRGINSGRTRPRDWFNSVVSVEVEALAQITAENMAELATQKMLIQ